LQSARQPDPQLDDPERLPGGDMNTAYVVAEDTLTKVGTVVRACDIPDANPEQAWLVDDIWREAGVGIVGGPPKGLKTWLVADLAVSVASGGTFLERHGVRWAGPVLCYFAEDSLSDIKARLTSLCRGRQIALQALDIHLIGASRLHLDAPFDFAWLEGQVRALRPRLLVLDPFVRIFRGNEDDAGHVAAVLGLLRKLQRDYGMAVALVHHARKGATTTSGATLRGSGDLHAWGDSNLYLTPTRAGSRVVVEHRSARAPEPFTVALRLGDQEAVEGLVAIEDVDDDDETTESAAPLDERVLALLGSSPAPLGLTSLQQRLRVGRTRLSGVLASMVEAERLDRVGDRYRVRTVPPNA
jgi:hypothetical protein